MNPLDYFKLPRLKLAATYLAIIMGMSIVFTFAIYNISDRELRNQRQLEVPRNLPISYINEFERLRDEQFESGQNNLRERLFIFNAVALVSGAILSYVLALRALQPIEEALLAQQRFTSDASHEIRTPLTVMRSEIEVALRDQNLSLKDARNTLESNLEEVQKLESLTSGLLQLARQENIQITKQKIPLAQLIERSITQVEPSAKKKKITLSAKKIKDYKISGEPQTLQQVIVILLDNAVKYSPEGSEVTVQTKNARNSHNIIITDKGPGIDPEDLPHVFERFYRSDKSRTKVQSASGYGLGLAIAKQIIDAHSGVIQISSKLGAGTTATIQIPKK